MTIIPNTRQLLNTQEKRIADSRKNKAYFLDLFIRCSETPLVVKSSTAQVQVVSPAN